MGTRLLFVGLDAFDPDLARRWAGEGHLPTLAGLMRSGAWGRSLNSPGLWVGSVWPSFWTGLAPGHHGRYCFRQLEAGSYATPWKFAESVEATSFWEDLSAVGCRVGVVDVPRARPARAVDGLHVIDWATHDPEGPFQTVPAERAPVLLERFGQPASACDAARSRAEEFARLREALLAGIEARRGLVSTLMREEDWDLFALVFSESHCAGHQFWSVHDPDFPTHSPALAQELGDPLRDVYVALDAALGELIAQAGPETPVFVLLSHGMGPHHDVGDWLEELLLRLERRRRKRAATLARAAESAWSFWPRSGRRPLEGLRRRARRLLGAAASRPAVDDRLWFAVPNNDAWGGIRINLSGREPAGRVKPGAEFEAACAELTDGLSRLAEDSTGRPLVRRVLRSDALYDGPFAHTLPDLLVEWDTSGPILGVRSPDVGRLSRPSRHTRTGDHQLDGLWLASGPGVVPGEHPAVGVERIAPTLAARLGRRLSTPSEPIPGLWQGADA